MALEDKGIRSLGSNIGQTVTAAALNRLGLPLSTSMQVAEQAKLTPAQSAYLGSVFAPGSGVVDASGQFPAFPGSDVPIEQAFSGEPMPSMAENIQAGGIDRYLYAPLQGLGVLGDAAYGIPVAGAGIAGLLKAPAALATVAGGIAKASKATKAADETPNFMFVHNTSEGAIKSFDAMGGIPSPSMAVQPADVPLKGFGDIQLIGKPEKFDPAIDPRNNVYSADAYTPRAPKKIRVAKEKAAEQLKKDYEHIASKYSKGTISDIFDQGQYALKNLQKDNLYFPENRIDEFERFFDSDLAAIKFLEDTGRNVDDYLMAPKSLGMVDFQKKSAALNPNSALYQTAIKDDGMKLTREFRKWVAKEKDKYLSQEGVFQYFDDFEETTVTKPYTLENVVNNMIKETQRGGESGMVGKFPPGRLRALMTEKMTDLPDIKSQRPRIEANPAANDLYSNVDEVIKSHEAHLAPDIDPSDVDYFPEGIVDNVGQALEDGADLEDAVKSSLLSIDIYPEKHLLDDLIDVFKYNATRPTAYLEAKPTRAVGFDEFAGAIVPPKTSQEVIDILENRGLKVVKSYIRPYATITKARNKFKDQMFSFAPVVGAGGIAALSLDANTEDEDKGVGSLN